MRSVVVKRLPTLTQRKGKCSEHYGIWKLPKFKRCDQKVLGLIGFCDHRIKFFVSRSFDLIEGHRECEKHAWLHNPVTEQIASKDVKHF